MSLCAMAHPLQLSKILLLLLLIMRTSGAHLTDTSFSFVEPGINVTGRTGAELRARSKIECSTKCLSDDACLGYQYQGKPNSGKCILINKDEDGSFQSTSGVVTYKKVLEESLKPQAAWPGSGAVLYYSCDDSDGFFLMEGTQQMGSVPLVAGKMNSAWSLDRTRSQWVDLGIHTEACMTRPETCGAAGGAISLWVNVIDCTDSADGIVSSHAGSGTGFFIYCGSSSIEFQVYLTDVYFYETYSRPSGWFHFVLNYIGDNNGETIQMHIDGSNAANYTGISGGPFPAGDGRIVVGKTYTDMDNQYTSVQLDELIFLNRTLMSDEIQSIYNSV